MLTNRVNVERYLVSGDTYAIRFPYWAEADIKAFITRPDESLQELVQGLDYAVTEPNAVSGTLRQLRDWGAAKQLTIVREVDLVQLTDLINGENIDAEILEKALDLAEAGLQQMQEQIDRTLKTSIDEDGAKLEIPNTEARKGSGEGTLMGFDGTGKKIILRDLKQFDADVASAAANAQSAEASAATALISELNARSSEINAWQSAGTASSRAEDSEAWAVGKRRGVDVPPTDPTYKNNSKHYSEVAARLVTGAVRYQTTWIITGQTDYSGLPTPSARGDMYICKGSATTIDNVTYSQNDFIIFNQDVPAGATITTSMLDHIDNTDSVTPDNEVELSNKTIDSKDNIIKNSPVVISSTRTYTPTGEKSLVIDTADTVLTLGNGPYDGFKLAVLAKASCTIVYTGRYGTITVSRIAGDYSVFIWNGSCWLPRESVSVSGTDDNGEDFEYSLDSLQEAGGGGGMQIDSAMSDNSPNAVMNRVIKDYVDAIKATIERGLATKADLDDVETMAIGLAEQIATVRGEVGQKADKSTTYTKTEVEALLDDKANKGDLNAFYTKTQTNTLLEGKADKSTTYTKTETDTLLAGKASATSVYTKGETDNLLNDKADKTELGTLSELTTEDKSNLVAALNEVYDKCGEPFRIKNWATGSMSVQIPYCTEDIDNTAIPKMDFTISGEEGALYQVVGMIAYEVKSSDGKRINCWPVCQFTGDGQKTLSVRWMCGGTTRKTATSMSAWVLLKRR